MGINLNWNTSSIPNQQVFTHSTVLLHADIKLSQQCSAQGKVYIITGANTGVGYAAAKTLASKNARVYMASRNRDKQQRSAEQATMQANKCQQAVHAQCITNAAQEHCHCCKA